MSTVTVRIENTYEDGHESVVEVEVETPADPTDLEDWWDDTVFEHTGDGHGADNPKLGAWYEAKITRADDEKLVGMSMDWG
jgi:hypothetical protein